MRLLRMDELSARDRYRWMSGAIVPRPIALVTTLTEKGGVVNAAPFSFFTMLASDPPLLSIAVERMEHFDPSTLISEEEMDRELGITQEEFDSVGEVEFE